MKMERCERHGTVREGYQILLRADAELLLPEDKPLMRAFYEHMGETEPAMLKNFRDLADEI